MNAWIVAAVCCMWIPTAGFAQERVRVTLPGEEIVGVVTRMNPDVLELELAGGGSRMLSRDEVLRMERGFVRGRWHWGYLIGSVAGTGAGLASFLAFRNALDDDAVFLTPLGFIAGGIAGSWIGASRKREVWEAVPEWTDERVRVTLSDSQRIVGVVSRITPDGIEVLLPGGARLVAMSDAVRMERRTARRQWKPGFVAGAAAGGALGALITVGIVGTGLDSARDQIAVLTLMSYCTGFYGLAGMLVGGLIKREGWEAVPGWDGSAATPRLLVGPRTMPNGDSSFVLGAALRF